MKIKAKFKGANMSAGFENGKTYDIEIIRNNLFSPRLTTAIPYGSVEAFLNNWEVIPPDDLTNYYREQKLKRINNDGTSI